jgi:hypothetical protein
MAPRETNGYVLNVPAARRELLLEELDSGPGVSEPVPDFKHSKSHPLICFVGFEDGAITHVAKGRAGLRAGSRLRRLHLEDLTRLSTAVRHDAVLERIPTRLKAHVAQRFEAGGLLPPRSFDAFVESVRELLPESNALLDRFSEKRRQTISRLGENVRRSLAYQKETLATALEFAGLGRDEVGDWNPPAESGEVRSFLDGLRQARLREDQMLLNDFHNFPGFDLIRTMHHGAAQFSANGVTLTVVMANRQPLEQQTGADLIYRNETFGAFVIVQYKAMEDEVGGAKFRLPNEQLAKELARMEELAAELQKCEPDSRLCGFRLTADPFFLKLCPRVIFDADSTGLIRGMYIPLKYWRRLEGDPSIEGQKEGRAVDFHNAGRYFDNTMFAALVAHGWIGTTGAQTEVLDALIREIVESGRSVTIAVKRTETQPTAADAVAAEVIHDDSLVSLEDLLDTEGLERGM